MKKILSYIYILFFVLVSCGMSEHQNSEEMPYSEQVVNDLLYQISDSLERKYKVNTIGISVAMPGGIVKKLGLDFQIRGPLSREEIRKVLINLVQDFLQEVNSNKSVKPFLNHYPFEIRNISITLFVVDLRGVRLDDPYIGIAGISQGKLDYQVLITTDIPSIKSEAKESYAEALKEMDNTK